MSLVYPESQHRHARPHPPIDHDFHGQRRPIKAKTLTILGTMVTGRQSLIETLNDAKGMGATNPRGQTLRPFSVYLWPRSRCHPEVLPPDYNKSVGHVYQDFARVYLHALGDLQFLTYAEHRQASAAAKASCSLVGCPGGLSRPSPRSGLIWTGAPFSPETQAPDAEDNSVRRPWDPPATWCAILARVACVKRPSIKRMQDVMSLWRHISS